MTDLYHHRRMISTATPTQKAVRNTREAENSLIPHLHALELLSAREYTPCQVEVKICSERYALGKECAEENENKRSRQKYQEYAQLFVWAALWILGGHESVRRSLYKGYRISIGIASKCFTDVRFVREFWSTGR